MKISLALLAVLVLSLVAGCATTEYKSFEAKDNVFEGKSGTKVVIDGMEFWDNGEPPRKFKVLGIIDDQLALLDVITQRHVAAHPHALGLRGGNLVANALSRDLALELCERKQHVEGQPAHRGRRIERLRHRHERGFVSIQHVDDLGEIGQRACQPIDLVDDHDLHFASLDISKQPLQCRPL